MPFKSRLAQAQKLDMVVKEQNDNTDPGYDEAWQVIRYGTLRVTFSPSFKVPKILNQRIKLSEK